MNASRTAGLCGDTTLAPVAVAITMELVETVFDVFSKIYALAEQAKSNKANCKKAATRCRGIESIVKNCQKEYQRYGGMSDEQRSGFDLLLHLFDSTLTYRSLFPGRTDVPALVDLLVEDGLHFWECPYAGRSQTLDRLHQQGRC